MLLAIDIGNTSITLGVYEEEELIHRWRISTNTHRMPDEYGLQMTHLFNNEGLALSDITGICLASVVPPLTSTFLEACHEYLDQEPLVIDAGVKTGVKILYEPPRSVGADRIVDAAAVQHLYGGPACVVDFGTGTTFNAISDEGDYLGGAIAPGIGIAAEALFQRAAKLPPVDLNTPPSVIGKNTPHAMQSGMIFGYVGLVEGMVNRFKKELGPEMKVIATGGYTEIIARETDVIDIIAPSLTLDGLRIIWEMNK
jgi:type III pantothenate kinase